MDSSKIGYVAGLLQPFVRRGSRWPRDCFDNTTAHRYIPTSGPATAVAGRNLGPVHRRSHYNRLLAVDLATRGGAAVVLSLRNRNGNVNKHYRDIVLSFFPA